MFPCRKLCFLSRRTLSLPLRVYVVPDYPEEVFFVSGSYWVVVRTLVSKPGSHQKWIMVRNSRVPRGIMRIPEEIQKLASGEA